jgi:hypothetical protein
VPSGNREDRQTPTASDRSNTEEGRTVSVVAYHETGLVSTFWVWLAYELFRGALIQDQFRASEESLFEYLGQKIPTKPYLSYLLAGEQVITVQVDGRRPAFTEVTASEIVVPQGHEGRLTDLEGLRQSPPCFPQVFQIAQGSEAKPLKKCRFDLEMVPLAGIEPALLAELDFESDV